jgi:hypothetical protein
METDRKLCEWELNVAYISGGNQSRSCQNILLQGLAVAYTASPKAGTKWIHFEMTNLTYTHHFYTHMRFTQPKNLTARRFDHGHVASLQRDQARSLHIPTFRACKRHVRCHTAERRRIESYNSRIGKRFESRGLLQKVVKETFFKTSV